MWRPSEVAQDAHYTTCIGALYNLEEYYILPALGPNLLHYSLF